MTDLSLTIRRECAADHTAIERLHERAFGPGRFARTAFRLREGVDPDPDLSFTALVGTLIVGSVRVTPAAIGPFIGHMLGPLTVDPAFEGRGIGAALMNRAIAAAREAGHRLILLVGDAPYFERVGFSAAPAKGVVMPGPVDQRRVLLKALREGGADGLTGLVSASH